MVQSLCFSCGIDKPSTTGPCPHCGLAPSSPDERAVSLVLSSHLSSESDLQACAREFRASSKPELPKWKMDLARDALNDPRLTMRLDKEAQAGGRPTVPASPPKQGSVLPIAEPAGALVRTTSLHRVSFTVLGASSRDDRRRIMALADEKSLETDHDLCQKARAELTNPRARLTAEMAWLPGIAPARAAQFLALLAENPMAVRSKSEGLPILPRLNLLAAVFECMSGDHNPEDLANFIDEMAGLAEELDAEAVMKDINEDRAAAGFPEIRSLDPVEVELGERRRAYRSAILSALDKLPSLTLVEVVTGIAENATLGGEFNAPWLIDEIIDRYEVETRSFLEQERGNAERMIEAIRQAARSNAPTVMGLVKGLEEVARNWDKVAQPIQISTKARGISHQASVEMAHLIRNLAIELFNEHDLLEPTQHINSILAELFAEVPDIVDHIENDTDTLEGIAEARNKAEQERANWEQEITYSVDIGTFPRIRLSISPNGVSWRGKTLPLDAITRMRWGGVRHSVNGIPTGTNYRIGVGGTQYEIVIELRNEQVFQAVIAKLWLAAGFRIIDRGLNRLKAGETLVCGQARVRDEGAILLKQRFFGSAEEVWIPWSEMQIWSADGSFHMRSKRKPKAVVSLSYIEDANTHFIEMILRMAFDRPSLLRLSELMD